MARTADKVKDDKPVERLVSMPGWVYNVFIDRANKERRPVKYQIELELEKLAQKAGTEDRERQPA